MSLLSEIQTTLLQDNVSIASVLLKFKYLAARLDSQPLQDWIKHELEGYPGEVDVPGYRVLQVAYRGTFSGPFGAGIKNAPIPNYLIEKYGGKGWTAHEMRQSIAAVDALAKSSNDGTLRLNASNLILLLQGKVYENFACNDVSGVFSVAQITELQHAVKGRLLELALEFEKIPGAIDISVGSTTAVKEAAQVVNQIFNQTVHGTMQNVNNTGSVETINFNGSAGDVDALIAYLTNSGITSSDAREFADLVRTESPENTAEPFGKKAKQWIAKNIKKAVDGTWKVGIGVATDVLSKGALAYYGLSS